MSDVPLFRLQPQAIFFDFDGVLAWSVSVKTQAFSRLYEDAGGEIQERVVDYHLAHGGVSRFEKIRYFEKELLGRSADPERELALANRFADLVKDAVVAAPTVPGAVETLTLLRQIDIPAYVVSGTPEVELVEIVTRRGWNGFFAGVYGAPTKKTDILCRLMERTKYDPTRCAMIGDATTDYDAAQSVSMPFIGILAEDQTHPFPEDTTVLADLRPVNKCLSEGIKDR